MTQAFIPLTFCGINSAVAPCVKPERRSSTIGRHLIIYLAAFLILATSAYAGAPAVEDLIKRGDALLSAEDRFPQSFEEALALYREASGLQPGTALAYLRMASVCLALGDGTKAKDNDKSLAWYKLGQEMAETALSYQENSSDAHFLLAATRGNVVNLLPFWKVSPAIIGDLEKHLLRSLALEPRHARANHMMGMLLYRTPGPLRLLLVGKRGEVEKYLLRSVESDPGFAQARFDLMQFYMQTGHPAQARAQAQALLDLPRPSPRRIWAEEYRPAAEQLLKDLPAS
jgi:tetratricopeptide (TPR) repeat protein